MYYIILAASENLLSCLRGMNMMVRRIEKLVWGNLAARKIGERTLWGRGLDKIGV